MHKVDHDSIHKYSMGEVFQTNNSLMIIEIKVQTVKQLLYSDGMIINSIRKLGTVRQEIIKHLLNEIAIKNTTSLKNDVKHRGGRMSITDNRLSHIKLQKRKLEDHVSMKEEPACMES